MNRDDLAKELEALIEKKQREAFVEEGERIGTAARRVVANERAISAFVCANWPVIIAALSASRPVGEVWRPIETAPRDGRLVILYSNGPGGIWLGYYGASRWYEHGMDGESYVEEDEVELWQPLPEPPRSHTEDSSDAE